MNLTSYAELAVRLVNTAFQPGDDPDPLGDINAFSVLVSDHPYLARAVTPFDLDALRALRTELTSVFTAAATGRGKDAADRLNAILVRCPIQPEIVCSDDEHWHVHLAETGSAADRYAAGAVIGLALTASQYGLDRLGVCSIASCQMVFIDSSPNRSRRYCADHSATRGNVTTIRSKAPSRSHGSATSAAG